MPSWLSVSRWGVRKRLKWLGAGTEARSGEKEGSDAIKSTSSLLADRSQLVLCKAGKASVCGKEREWESGVSEMNRVAASGALLGGQ